MMGLNGLDNRKKLSSRERDDRRKLIASALPATNVKRGDTLKGKVYNVTEDGAFIFTDEKYIGFVHVSEQTQTLREGMNVEGRVTFVRADGRVNLSLRPQKEHAMAIDSARIVEYLKKRNGSMPYNDDTDPEVIRAKFGISKSSFKRALGKLFKDGAVFEQDGWVMLKTEDE